MNCWPCSTPCLMDRLIFENGRLPICGARFSVLVSILESLNRSQGVVDVSPNGEIIDKNVPRGFLFVGYSI